MGIGNVVSDALWKVPIVAAYSVVYAPVASTDTGDSVLSGQS